jgi:hypothetical protein
VSLRSGIIEAGADAWARFEEGGDYELTGVQFARLREVSTVMLDAILDYLEANADEWDRSVSEHYKRTMDSHARHFNAWWFVAALRVGASPVLTVPGLAEENQP